MKLITAIFQPDKLDAVREALMDAEISRLTVGRVTGHGRQEDVEIYRGTKVVPNLNPKVRIDIAVNEKFVETTVETIIRTAKHGDGEIGDGKIIITPIDDCIRIRTGERGTDAI